MTNLFKYIFMGLLLFGAAGCNTQPAKEGAQKGVDTIPDKKELRVFICVDMEGMAGVVHVKDCNEGGMDYQYFRETATNEVNAAIRGAFKAGATKVVVRDAHETMRNIIPGLLDSRVELIRGGDGANPQIMMQGIEQGFDAMLFVGHHAAAGTPRGVLAHTMVVDGVQEFSINGIQIPEMAYCALIAGKYGVPVAYLSGDDVTCTQAKEYFGEKFATTATKEAFGWKVAKCYPIEKVHKQIEKDVYNALKNPDNFSLYNIAPPYKSYLRVKEGSDKEGKPVIKEYSWESENLNDMMAFFWEKI